MGTAIADTAPPPVEGPEAIVVDAAGSTAALESLLSAHGWKAHRDAGGNLILEPGSQIPDDGFDRFRSTLETHGWRVERDPEGNLLLIPAEEEPLSSEPTAPAAAATADPAGPDLEGMATGLRQRGWTATLNEAGHLILSPGQAEEIPATETDSPETHSAAGADDPMAEALRQGGWQVERDANGNLLLYPKAEDPTPMAHSPCQFDTFASITRDTVTLPVDRWNEAHSLAQAWISKRGNERVVVVGKIRRINRLYVVSIVSLDPPHALSNQLVIRAPDGGVLGVFEPDLIP